jgi:hypothetical protein
MDGQQLASAFKNLPTTSSSSAGLDELNAVQGVGAALTAQSNGFVLSGTETFDPSKLTSAEKAALQAGSHQNTTLAFTPAQAFGVFAIAGFDKSASAVISELDSIYPSLTSALDELGVTGNSGILNKLTGDVGVELEPATGTIPVDGALLVGTNDGAAMQTFLDSLPSVITQADPSLTLSVQRTTYKGTVIGSLSVGGSVSLPDQPSWAVYQGMGIIASSPAGVMAAMDARDGQNITSSSGYSDAIPADQGSSADMVYVNLQSILQYVRNQLSASDRLAFDLEIAPITNHLTEFSVTGQSGSNSSTFRVFLGVG